MARLVPDADKINRTARGWRSAPLVGFRGGVLIAALLLAPSLAVAQTCSGGNCTAASLAASDVQACINSTTAGHTCTLPSGSGAWTTSVTNNKNISIVGAGAGRIVAYAYIASPLTIGTGSKSLTITGSTFVSGTTPPATAPLTNVPISVGQTVRLSELGFRANFMQGTVSSWNTSTGALTLNVTSSGGTCGTSDPNMPSNCKRWLLSTIPSTVIANNVTSGLGALSLTESTAGSMYVSGIKFATGSGTVATIYTTRTSGGQAIVIHDSWIENINGIIPIDGNTDRGLFYNTSIDNSPFSVIEDIRIKDPNNTAMPNSWTTVSTFGANDTAGTAFCSTCLAGQNNQYIENVDFHAGENVIDWDDNARGVVRYSFFDNAGMGSHGADTSEVGVRHFEIYNNVGGFVGYNDGTTANMNWWLFTRGGTTAMHDNVFPAITSTDYGTKSDVTMPVENLDRNGGQHPCWGEGTTSGADYYAPRQNGFGRVTGSGTTSGSQASCPSPVNCSANHFSGSTDAYTYVGDSEPVYIWNNRRTTGGLATNLTISAGTPIGQCTSPDSTSNYVVAGRDYFNNGTAKPSYSDYIYPHPLAGFSGHSYSTSFPLTENPISESGVWLNGSLNGLDWDNVQTTTNKAFGTGIQGNPPYNDSTAALTGAWNSNQEASGVLYLANGSDTASQEEVELRLNTSITAHSITGYECDLSAFSGAYAAIVRWNGAVNDFTQLAFAPSVTPIHNGDTFKCSQIGGTITMYINGTSILTATDSTFTGGSPGIGFWQTGGTTAMLSHYGFSSFAADDNPGGSYTWTPTVVGSGTITGTNSTGGSYTAGTTIGPLTATPSSGYTFTGWSGVSGNAACSGTTNPCSSFALNSNSAATATFTAVTYTLGVTATHGSISGTHCSAGTYPSGTTIGACTATPATGYVFTGWSGTGSCSSVTGTGTATCTLTSNSTLTASFAINTYGWNLTITGPGTVTGTNSTSGTYNYGTTIGPLTATPATGYYFAGWGMVSGSASCAGTANPCPSFSLTSSSTATASFFANTYVLSTATAGTGSGTVICSPSGGVVFNSAVSCTVTANTGSTISTVSGCGGTWSSSPYTFNMPAGNCTVTANFTLGSASLTVTTSGTGSGTVTGANCSTGSYSYGSTIGPCTATPGSTSSFTGWTGTGDASTCSGTGACTFTLTSTSTLTAAFGPQTAATPTFTPAAGTYPGTQTVTISTATGVTTVAVLPESQNANSSTGVAPHRNTYTNCATGYNGTAYTPVGQPVGNAYCTTANQTSGVANGGATLRVVGSTISGLGTSALDNGNGAGGSDAPTSLTATYGGSGTSGCTVGTNNASAYISGLTLPGATSTSQAIFGIVTPSSSFNTSLLSVTKYNMNGDAGRYLARQDCVNLSNTTATGAHYELDDNYNDSTGTYFGFGFDYDLPNQKFRACPQGCSGWTNLELCPVGGGACLATYTPPTSGQYLYLEKYEHWDSGCSYSSLSACAHYDAMCLQLWSGGSPVAPIACYTLQNASTHASVDFIPINKTSWTHPQYGPQHQWDINSASKTMTATVGFSSLTAYNGTSAATICYTTDGSTPTADGAGTCTHGTTYTGPITVSSTTTVKAIASESGYADSVVGTATYTINGSASTPTFSPVAGTYATAQSVTISSSTTGATLCYTTDGSSPTADGNGTCTHGTTYSGPVSVASSLTLKAVASKSGFTDSSVGSAAYTISPAVAAPTISGTVKISGTAQIQ